MDISKRDLLLIYDALYTLMKDNLSNHRFQRDEYMERKNMVDDLMNRKLKLQGIQDTEDSKQMTVFDRMGQVLSVPKEMRLDDNDKDKK